MKKILVLQHEVSAPPALTTEWAEKYKIELDIQMVKDIAVWPSITNYDGLIILGGSMDTWQEEKFPWLKNEKKFLKDAIHTGTKIFGICLGCQLLAEVMGGAVVENPDWEIGWLPVSLSPQETIHFAQYHKFKVTIPKTLEPFGTSEFCDTQGFKYKNQIFATQFHPEADEGWFSGKLPEGANPNGINIHNPTAMRAGEFHHLAKARQWYFAKCTELFGN